MQALGYGIVLLRPHIRNNNFEEEWQHLLPEKMYTASLATNIPKFAAIAAQTQIIAHIQCLGSVILGEAKAK
eukprot:scaffold115752_cov19-Prasinocladus_malaysianus.AAC.1